MSSLPFTNTALKKQVAKLQAWEDAQKKRNEALDEELTLEHVSRAAAEAKSESLLT